MASRIGRVAAPRTYGGELGKARHLNPPALVLRQMKVEDVDLVAGEEIERAQHRWLRLEVTGDVEHEPAVAETRSVHHPDRRQDNPCGWRGRGQQAAQGLQ